MSRTSKALFASLASAALLAALPSPATAAPRAIAAKPSGGQGSGYRPSYRGGGQPSHSGGHHGYSGYRGHSGYGGHYGGHYPGWGWGWGVGIGLGVPWTLGWYDPWWGYPAYGYPAYGYGPAYGNYAYSCGPDEECLRGRFSQSEPDAPTTQLPPPVPGAEGGPTQRPLHLNYCDSARAWFPQVRTCPGGWRLVRPEYGN